MGKKTIELTGREAKALLELMNRGIAYTEMYYARKKGMYTTYDKVKTRLQKLWEKQS